MVHSAFGYGNATALCNDPHSQPFTNLDDGEAVKEARAKSNIQVKICRIGPWVFPIEVTTRFLPKGDTDQGLPTAMMLVYEKAKERPILVFWFFF